MIDLTTEGKQYIVFIKVGSNTYQTSFRNWEDAESFVTSYSPGECVHKIMSVEAYEIPLTGLKLKS